MRARRSDFEQALILLDQVIEKSEIDDRIERVAAASGRKPLADGDGWITHHLKLTRELLENHKNAKNKK